MEDFPLTLLLFALTLFVFVLTCAIVGVLAYKLGLNGRIERMMAEADQAKAEVRKEKEPAVVPGDEFNPFVLGHPPRYEHQSHREDAGEEEDDGDFVSDDDIAEHEIEQEPVVPGKPSRKHGVVMTGGGYGVED